MTKFGFHTTAEEAAAALSSHIKGRTVIVTGVSPGGLGLETARAIALQSPKLIVLAGRSESKVKEAQEIIQKAAPDTPVRQLLLDLSSISKVRKAAQEVNSWTDVPLIDVVINNAGIMACPYKLTEDGIESQFGANHIGHFLFTQLIMEKILAAGEGARVVNLSSNGYKVGSGIRYDDINFGDGKDYDPWASYAQSKAANIIYSKALVQKYGSKGLKSYSVHPGVIWTNLGHHVVKDLQDLGFMDAEGNQTNEKIVWKNLGEGSSTSIVAAFDPSISADNGAYMEDCNVCETVEDYINDPEAPQKLWDLSERLVGQKF